MRIELKEGIQKELLKKIKFEKEFTWNEFADYLDVKEGALLEWFKQKTLLPYEIFRKLNGEEKYSKQILGIKEDNWGQIKGGSSSCGTLKTIKIPKHSEKLAEFIGIILGDGNIHKFVRGKNVRVYSVRIAGDYEKEKHYHEKFIVPFCSELFEIEPKINISKRRVRYVCIYSKKLVEFLERMNLNPGSKIKNQSTIPDWIKENNQFLQVCLRGLIDTDGSIFRMSKKDPHLLRIGFKNHNKRLIKDVKNSFEKLGYYTSKITHNSIYISRKSDVERYIKEIGFSNKKHLDRLNAFNSPVV